MADVGYDARDLRNFGRALRKTSRDGYKQYRRALKEATVDVVAEARGLAQGKGVAATIKPFAVGGSIGVQVGKDGSVGKAFEIGNSEGSSSDALRGAAMAATQGKFGHPVFGRKGSWVLQDMHPAVIPTVVANEGKTIEKLLKGVNRALADVGLEME
jgi:hypothetical protein